MRSVVALEEQDGPFEVWQLHWECDLAGEHIEESVLEVLKLSSYPVVAAEDTGVELRT